MRAFLSKLAFFHRGEAAVIAARDPLTGGHYDQSLPTPKSDSRVHACSLANHSNENSQMYPNDRSTDHAPKSVSPQLSISSPGQTFELRKRRRERDRRRDRSRDRRDRSRDRRDCDRQRDDRSPPRRCRRRRGGCFPVVQRNTVPVSVSTSDGWGCPMVSPNHIPTLTPKPP